MVCQWSGINSKFTDTMGLLYHYVNTILTVLLYKYIDIKVDKRFVSSQEKNATFIDTTGLL